MSSEEEPLAAIARAAGGALRPDPVTATTRRVRLVDTVDRRLLARGWCLQAEPGGRWRLTASDGSVRAEAELQGADPAVADDLPDGRLRDDVADAAWIRALRPGPWIVVEERHCALRDDGGKIRCRLRAETATVEDGGARRSAIRVLALKGYEADAARVAAALARHPGGAGEDRDPLAALAGIVHPPPAGTAYPAVTDPREAAGDALRPVLRALLDTVEQRSRGVIADIDSEELHDLRVAVRRSRSILSLLDDAGPELAFARGFFKWLGAVTGPTRDLDVHILAWRDRRRCGGDHGGSDELAPLGRHLAAERAVAQAALVRVLRSRRFADGVRRWRRSLERGGPSWRGGAAMRQPVGALAGRRIRKLYRRAVAEGAAITAASPDEALHALRKTMKKFRYVFEIVRDAYPREPAREILRVVKDLQQELGEVQDMAVQADALHRFGVELAGRDATAPETLMAIGAWAESLQAGRAQARVRFPEVFEPFASTRFGDRLRVLTRVGTEAGG